MSTKKTLPPPDGGDGLQAALRGRYVHDDERTLEGGRATHRTVATSATRASSGGEATGEALGTVLPRSDDPAAQLGAESATRPMGATNASSRTKVMSANNATGAVRRSWYMTAGTADALASALEDEHFATRRSKTDILAAIVRTALAHRDEWHRHLATGE